jgi:hypothetical protein
MRTPDPKVCGHPETRPICFVHMTNRSADVEDYTAEQFERLQEGVYSNVIAVAIDSFMAHLAENQ